MFVLCYFFIIYRARKIAKRLMKFAFVRDTVPRMTVLIGNIITMFNIISMIDAIKNTVLSKRVGY